MRAKHVVGIVITYNISEKELLQNISTYIQFVNEIIIVDNSDNDKFKINIHSNRIKTISMGENKGIAAGLNVGMQYAINNEYKFALTMDQDSRFNNNLIKYYFDNYREDVIIYSPVYLIERKKTKKYSTPTIELYWTMTSGNLVNVDLYKKVGEFKEDFFIDVVDYEYCLRSRKSGYKILQCNDAKLIHNPGITKHKRFLLWKFKYGYMSPSRMYYQIRNLLVVANEFKSIKARLIVLIKFLKILLFFENKKEFYKMFCKGISDYKKRNMGKLNNSEI